MATLLKLIGVLVIILGCVLTYKPNLLSHTPLPKNNYHLIEMRVRWGFLIGLGIFIFAFNHWNSWKVIISAFLFFLTIGIVIARTFGIIKDGFFIKQILWLSIEFVILIVFGILYKYAHN